MPFKIRTKLLVAFLAIIAPFLLITSIIALYNQIEMRKSHHMLDNVSKETLLVSDLQHALERVLMPGNDYIITGEKEYIDAFQIASKDLERTIRELDSLLVAFAEMGISEEKEEKEEKEEREVLNEVKDAWRNIREISLKIFAIPAPVGSRDAARLMEEMDYYWSYPAVKKLERWHEIDKIEYRRELERSQKVWLRSWVIMISGAFILIVIGILFALYYSGIFVMPIKMIHNRADAIAKGDFKARLDIKTGDEFEQLAKVMNDMAAQLDSFYTSLQGMVDERTRELRESEIRLHAIIETAKDAIICIAGGGIIYLWNKSAEDMFGYKAEEAMGKDVHSLLIPERFRDTANKGLKVFSQTGTGPVVGKHVEVIAVKEDGAEFPVELSISAMRIKDKWHAVGIIRDITERKKAEEALKESEKRYRRLIESVTDYIYTVQFENGRPVKTTHGPGVFAITGYTSEEYEADPDLWLRMAYQEDMDAVVRQAKMLSSGDAIPLEHRIVCKEGQIRWIRNVPVPRYDENDRLIAYDGLISDITERKKAEETLERAKKEWEATFDGITDPLFIHDKELNVVRANRAYQVMAGIKFEEFIGKPYYEVFPKMEKPFRICLKALELQEEEEEEEEEFSCPLTNRIFKIRFYPIKDVNGGYLYSIHILEDITEAKRAEEKIKEEELRYRTIFEQSPAGIVIIDPETVLPIEFNETTCRQLGYSREEFAKLPVSAYEAIDSPEQIKARAEKLLREGKDTFETKHRTKNGEIRNVQVAIQSLILSGKPLFYCVFRDITEVRSAEKKMMEEMEITSHLLMISEATAGMTDVNKLMEQAAHCSREVLGCDICLAYLWDKEERLFRSLYALELPSHLIPIFMTEPIKEKDFIKGFSQRFKDLFTWSKELPIGNIVTIPLTSRKEYLGLIIGIFSNKVELADRHIKVIGGISRQVSAALEEAKLYRETVDKTMELSHKIETIRVMHEIDRNILSTLNSDEILEATIRVISRVVPCDRATVAIVNRERQGFIYAAGFGVTFLPKGAFVSFSDTNATEVIETGNPQYIANLADIKKPLPLEEKFVKDGFLSHIRLPLTVKGEIVAILSLGAKRPSAYTPEDLSTLEKIASQIGVALSNARLISDLEELFLGVVKSLSSAIDAKSPWTAGHSERVTKYALQIGNEMGLSGKELRRLELAGLLHDVGKIGTYESILDKPSKLNDEEQAVMRRHPVKGAEILAPIKQLKDIIPAIKYHQEFFDGSGYPEGIKGEAIPLFARIIGVADTVDAMGADRPYRKGRPMDAIVAELKRCSGTQFDPKVVEAFLRIPACEGKDDDMKMAAN